MAKRKKKRRAVNLPAETLVAAQRETRKVDLAEEYAYVISDLTRMAVLAAVLIAALVALSFFL